MNSSDRTSLLGSDTSVRVWYGGSAHRDAARRFMELGLVLDELFRAHTQLAEVLTEGDGVIDLHYAEPGGWEITAATTGA